MQKHNTFKRDNSYFDEASLLEEIQPVKWVQYFGNACVNDIINKHISIVNISRKEQIFKRKHWITLGLNISINTKNKLLKKYLNSRNEYYHYRYTHYRNKVKHELQQVI